MRPPVASLPLSIALALGADAAHAATVFDVDTTDDTVDAVPGNLRCEDAQTRCSLRAAVMEVQALIHAGIDSEFEIYLPPGDYVLTRETAADETEATGTLRLTGMGQETSVSIRGWEDGAPASPSRRPRILAGPLFRANLFRSTLGGTVSLADLELRGARATSEGQGGTAIHGAAVSCQDAGGQAATRVGLTLDRVTLADNTHFDSSGRALAAQSCHLTLRDVVITDHDIGASTLVVLQTRHSEPVQWVFENVSIVGNRCDTCNSNAVISVTQTFNPQARFALDVRDSTIAGNGGGVALSLPSSAGGEPLGEVVLRNVTMADNDTMASGANALSVSGNVVVGVANSAMVGAQHLVSGSARLVSLGHNLLGDITPESNGSFEPHVDDLPADTDAQLEELRTISAYAVGLTPAADSPLVDAGHPGVPDELLAERCTSRDARGVVRPVGAGCDIGAVEYFDADIFADGFEWS